MVMVKKFTKQLLAWFDRAGRKHLPWQQNKTPYRVWVSEIMLQQTQVATVIPYYERFMQRFPNLAALADGSVDEVLHLWAGLGYYSRARNLHRAAVMVRDVFSGQFPDSYENLIRLPGIGQSTAGAILSIAYQQPVAILDGNVKRVLARFHAVRDPINQKSTEDFLWELANEYTPAKRNADYTQAIMDLGATICTRRKPLCGECPVRNDCLALKQDLVAELPQKTAARKIPVRTATFLIIQHGSRILLQKRPPVGIWGGLFSLPEIDAAPDANSIQRLCRQLVSTSAKPYQSLPAFRHTFSHYHLDIHPVLVSLKKLPVKLIEADIQVWYNVNQPEALGLPKPVHKIIQLLTS